MGVVTEAGVPTNQNNNNNESTIVAILLPQSLKSQEYICSSFDSKMCTFCVKLAIFITNHRKTRKL